MTNYAKSAITVERDPETGEIKPGKLPIWERLTNGADDLRWAVDQAAMRIAEFQAQKLGKDQNRGSQRDVRAVAGWIDMRAEGLSHVFRQATMAAFDAGVEGQRKPGTRLDLQERLDDAATALAAIDTALEGFRPGVLRMSSGGPIPENLPPVQIFEMVVIAAEDALRDVGSDDQAAALRDARRAVVAAGRKVRHVMGKVEWRRIPPAHRPELSFQRSAFAVLCDRWETHFEERPTISGRDTRPVRPRSVKAFFPDFVTDAFGDMRVPTPARDTLRRWLSELR